MSEQIRREIGRLLRGVRHERGLGLEDVEALTGQIGWPVSRSRLSMVERGETDLRLSDLYALSRSYGIPVTDLIAESLVAHAQRKPFPEERTPEELFEEGKTRFRYGFPMEAAWAFEEAGRRASDDPAKRDFVFLCRVSAGHCYERAGAMELALKRVESVIDEAEEGSDVYLRALGKVAILLARRHALGRARLLDKIIEGWIRPRIPSSLRAFLNSARAVVHACLNSPRDAAKYALRSSRLYHRTGDFAMAAKLAAEASLYYLRAGDHGKALRVAQDAAADAKSLDHVEAALVTHLALAESYFATGDFEKARESAEEGARLASKHGYEVDASWAYALLEEIDEHLGRSAQARRWKQRKRAYAPAAALFPPYVPPARWGRR